MNQKAQSRELGARAVRSILLLVVLLVVIGLFWSTREQQENPPDVPEWVNFPDDQWQLITPKAAGLDEDKFRAWVHSQKPEFSKAYGGQKPDRGGVVIGRGGYLIHQWGDPDFKYQSASLGKTFTRMVLQLAVDEGLIKDATDAIYTYWSGAGQLDAHKALNRGHHRTLSFHHLAKMKGGFPVTNGYLWENKSTVDKGDFYPGLPKWAKWTGDSDYDNYAHVEPGEHQHYSSGGYWRLSQALTAIWKQDLKRVLDERIMSKIGIPAERWKWMSGKQMREDVHFYPKMPGYGEYLDPPYTIDGIVVRGGPGWVVMSANDLARVGFLIATGGQWKGEHLISKVGGNSGVNANTVDGWSVVEDEVGYLFFGKVATGFDDPTPELMASWIDGHVQPGTQVAGR